MSKKTKAIYIVKFKSTGKDARMKYNNVYDQFAIIDTGGDINEVIERFRIQEQGAMQESNKGVEVITTLVSKKKINVTSVLISKKD